MRIARLNDVMRVMGLGCSTVFKYITEGAFPKSVPLRDRCVGWLEIEILGWIVSKVEERGGGG